MNYAEATYQAQHTKTAIALRNIDAESELSDAMDAIESIAINTSAIEECADAIGKLIDTLDAEKDEATITALEAIHQDILSAIEPMEEDIVNECSHAEHELNEAVEAIGTKIADALDIHKNEVIDTLMDKQK